jgi:hypothetical protein
MLLVLVPDAEAPYQYGWCVEAPGYRPLIRPMDDATSEVIVAPLVPDASAMSCPTELQQRRLEDGTYLKRPA